MPADLRHLAPGPEPCPEGGRAERPSSGPMGLGVSSDVSSGGLAERPGDRPGSALAMAFHEEQILQILHFLPPRDAMRIHLASKASVMSRCAVNDMLWTAQWAAQLPAALARSPDSSSQGQGHGSGRVAFAETGLPAGVGRVSRITGESLSSRAAVSRERGAEAEHALARPARVQRPDASSAQSARVTAEASDSREHDGIGLGHLVA